MTATTIDRTAPESVVGRLINADGRWHYVTLADGDAWHGVALDFDSHNDPPYTRWTVADPPRSSGRWDTPMRGSSYGMHDLTDTAGLAAVLAEHLARPTPATGGAADDDGGAFARGVEQGRRDQRATDLREFEEWKRQATETAHEYANNNDLCSEFDRCMTEIGLEPRTRDYVVTFRVRVEASSEDDATEQAMDTIDPSDIYNVERV